MILKDLVHIVWNISTNVLQYLVKISPFLYYWEMKIWMIHMCQETLRFHPVSFILSKHINPLELVASTITVTWIIWSSYSFRFSEESFIISCLIPVRKVPYKNFSLEQHMMHPVLQMWMPSNFDWCNMMLSTVAKFSRIVRSASWC